MGWLPIALALLAAAPPPLSERLTAWKREVEQFGHQVVVARIETDRETGQPRIPAGTPWRADLGRLLGDPRLGRQFAATHAMTISYQASGGRVHFVLVNQARADEFARLEEPLLAHELGHAWLDARGFRSLDVGPDAEPCLAIHSSDMVQHVLIRAEVERRGIRFQDYWIPNLNQALDALEKDGPAPASGPCDSLARISLWTDVRLGLSPDAWNRYGEFDREFRRRLPELAATVDELVAVLSAVDLTARDRYQRALAYVQKRLAMAAGMDATAVMLPF